MNENKNPHPAGDTAEQGERGAVWSDSSNSFDCISGGAGRQGRIVRFLLPGEENAIPAPDLTRLTGYSNTRSLRVAIDRERERNGDFSILASEKGYFLPASGERRIAEMRQFVRRTDARAASNWRTIRLIRARLRELEKRPLEGQETLWREGDT